MMDWPSIFPAIWLRGEPVDEGALVELQQALPFTLPEDYVELLRWSDGGEGALGEVHFRLWRCGEILKRNEGYGFQEWLPDVLVVGTDEASFYALDTSGSGMGALRFPVGFMHPSGIDERRADLKALLGALGRGEIW